MDVDTIAKQLFFVTLRLVNRDRSGRTTTGTGFVMEGSLRADTSAPMLVTNKHVVENAGELDVQFIGKDPTIDRPLYGSRVQMTVADADQAFVGHPDPNVDVAVMPLQPVLSALTSPVFFRSVGTEVVPSDEQMQTFDALEELIFIGYPDGRFDGTNLTPIARRGLTATPMNLDFDGQPRFLLDGSVFGGSSGSPVFSLKDGVVQGSSIVIGAPPRLFLVGIVAATAVRTQVGEIVTASQPHVEFAQELNLGVIFKQRAIQETIDAVFARRGLSRM